MNLRLFPLAACLAALPLALPAHAHAQSNPLREPGAGIPHVDLDAQFTYGLGNGNALGGQVNAFASWDLWRTHRALGAIDLGLSFGYVNEPIALQPWNQGTATTGTTHRIPFSLSLGHTFRFGREDRFSFGVHGYVGGVHWISSYRVRFPSRGIEGDGSITDTVKDAGVFLRFTYRPHPVVGLSLQLGAPIFGVSPETIVGLFTIGGGLTVRLR